MCHLSEYMILVLWYTPLQNKRMKTSSILKELEKQPNSVMQ